MSRNQGKVIFRLISILKFLHLPQRKILQKSFLNILSLTHRTCVITGCVQVCGNRTILYGMAALIFGKTFSFKPDIEYITLLNLIKWGNFQIFLLFNSFLNGLLKSQVQIGLLGIHDPLKFNFWIPYDVLALYI